MEKVISGTYICLYLGHELTRGVSCQFKIPESPVVKQNRHETPIPSCNLAKHSTGAHNRILRNQGEIKVGCKALGSPGSSAIKITCVTSNRRFFTFSEALHNYVQSVWHKVIR